MVRSNIWASGLGMLGCVLVACSDTDGASKQPVDDARDGGRDAASPLDAGDVSRDAAEPADDGGPKPGTDGGADAGESAEVSACLEAAQSKDSLTEALEFAGDDGTQVALVRYVDPDAFGTSGTTVWLAERLGYARGADYACVTDPAKLEYTISHHNFDDLMDAQVGDVKVTFHQERVDYDMPWSFTAQAKRGETVVWGPVDLSVVSCKNLTTDEDCSGKY